MLLQLFGTFAAQVDGRPLLPGCSRKAQWLLAFLALQRGREVERANLAGLLWPETTHDRALFYVRRALVELREILGPAAPRLVSPHRHTVALDLSDAHVDVLAFDAALARGDEVSLECVVELYRGPLLAECDEDWVLQERLPREQAYLHALETLAGHALARGDALAAVKLLRQAVALDPCRETAQQALLKALMASDDTIGALLAYRAFRLHLHQELRAEPSPETQALFRQLRAKARHRGEGSDAGTLSMNGRKAEARREGPSPITAPSAPRRLPRPFSQFVGRESELHALAASLESARLVTITGPGGVGKTRMAIQVADAIADDHLDGVWFVDLTRLSEPALVPRAVASVLAMQEQPDRPLTESLAEFLGSRELLLVLDNCEHLLDACAELVEALLSRSPKLRILATSRQSLGLTDEVVWPLPGLSVPPPPREIAAPNPEALLQFEAVRLFVARAQSVTPVFALTERNAGAVAEICRRLEGIPLAIELASARLRALSVEQLAARLDDRFRLLTSGSRTALPRHQTLRATLDWSYDLLSETERALLRRLSVFAGRFTLEAAEAVCSDSGLPTEETASGTQMLLTDPIQNPESRIQNQDVLDLLALLVDKSLVMPEGWEGEQRYRLLETVREYAAERLNMEEWSSLAQRHAAYYLTLAEQAASLLSGPEQSIGQERLEREHENLRAALAWAQTTGSAGTALRLAAALWRFWWLEGHLREGRDRLTEVLALAEGEAPTAARAQALHGAGRINDGLGNAAAAMQLTTQSLAVWQQVGDPYGIADALNQLGDLATDRSELHAAQERFEGALALYRELQDRSGIALTIYNLARVAMHQTDVDAADALLLECQRLCQELGDRSLLASALTNQGRVALWRGDVARARPLLEEALSLTRALGVRQRIAWSLLELAQAACLQNDLQVARSAAAEALAICRQIDNWPGIGWALSELADIVYAQGEIEVAAGLYDESLAVAQKLGNTRGIGGLLFSLGQVSLRREDTAAAHTHFTQALALHRQIGNRLGEALALEGLAEVAAAREQLTPATRLLAAAARLWEQLPGRPPSREQESTERLLSCLRSSLDEEGFAAAWAEGRACQAAANPTE